MTRQIELMRPWAMWAVRHRLGWALIALNWTLHPVAFAIHAAISNWREVWEALVDTHNSISQAIGEAKAEKKVKP